MSEKFGWIRRSSLVSLLQIFDIFINLRSKSTFFKFLLLVLFSFFLYQHLFIFFFLIKPFMKFWNWFWNSLVSSHKKCRFFEAILDHFFSEFFEVNPVISLIFPTFIYKFLEWWYTCELLIRWHILVNA